MSALGPNSAVPAPSQTHVARGYGSNSIPNDPAPLSQSLPQQSQGKFTEDWNASRQRGSSIIDGQMLRSNSVMSQGDTLIASRGGTLKKKKSLVRRNSSRRSSRAGSVRSLALQAPSDSYNDQHSAFFSPVPTTGNPTEILAHRFQSWRKVLKDLIAYFKELQAHYDSRGKSLLKVSNLINNTTAPPNVFLSSGGLNDALEILRSHHTRAIEECNKAKEIENNVILSLVGLRSDLQQKIKEIKNLSGDFKNSVEKEMDNTRKAVNTLQGSLGQSDVDPSSITGKQDPYLLRLAVARQVERQIDEENYLHQAYLNLEASGRELEAIVVGEIQKSYNALAGVLRREADGLYSTIEELRTGPVAMPKDHEWTAFIENDEHFVDPRIPVREAQNIHYPGRDSELAAEVRAGLLERKSKYLKSYTPGWFVLTPTHIHEFKSADKTQAPIMSLYLPEQKLGSHSTEGGSSNKFMLKGRQTGAMHRGHSWVFRAESHETMMAWYEDVKNLTEKSSQERNTFVRQHAHSISGSSQRAASVASSDGLVDEDDDEPFSATASAVVAPSPKQDILPRRPNAGGRFPSDIVIDTQRGLQAPLSPSSGSSGAADVQDHDAIAGASALPGNGVGETYGGDPTSASFSPTHAAMVNHYAEQDGINPYTSQPIPTSLGQSTSQSAHIHAMEQQPGLEAVVADGSDAPPPADREIAVMSGGRSQGDVTVPAPINDLSPQDTTTIPQGQTSSVPIQTASESLADNQSRPTLAALEGQEYNASAQSISQLHVPGEYPKNTRAKEAIGAKQTF